MFESTENTTHIIASGDGHNLAQFGKSVCDDGTRRSRPTIRASKRQSQDVISVLVAPDECINDNYMTELDYRSQIRDR